VRLSRLREGLTEQGLTKQGLTELNRVSRKTKTEKTEKKTTTTNQTTTSPMQLDHHAYYHIYNRTNAGERAFPKEDHYRYFLKKYRHELGRYLETIAYCLMPTHFHFLVRVSAEAPPLQGIGGVFGKLLSSYTRALNRRLQRHGSLFQQHTKALHIDDERYLLAVLAYIHNNPVRAGLVEQPEQWLYSSYQDYCGVRQGTLPNKELVEQYFPTLEEFRRFSHQQQQQPKYWV
jgi:REP element-mobilizing transposase RayT